MTQHTPGPWHAIAYEHYHKGTRISNFTVYTDATYPEGSVNNLNICTGYGGLSEGFPHRAAGMANAHLLVAAPELLDSTQALLREVKAWREGHNTLKGMRNLNEARVGSCFASTDDAKRAIAKAHGEAYYRNEKEE